MITDAMGRPFKDNDGPIIQPFIPKTIIQIVATRGWVKSEIYACHLDMVWPQNSPRRLMVISGAEVGAAYESAIEYVVNKLNPTPTYVFTVEDDMLPPQDALHRLLTVLQSMPPDVAAIGGLYNTKEEQTKPLLFGQDYSFMAVPKELGLVETSIMPMGCTLYRTDVFKKMPRPWFETTAYQTQDAYFSLRATKLGWKFYIDTRIQCGHMDVDTGKIY
jgi:hypothetical protein